MGALAAGRAHPARRHRRRLLPRPRRVRLRRLRRRRRPALGLGTAGRHRRAGVQLVGPRRLRGPAGGRRAGRGGGRGAADRLAHRALLGARRGVGRRRRGVPGGGVRRPPRLPPGRGPGRALRVLRLQQPEHHRLGAHRGDPGQRPGDGADDGRLTRRALRRHLHLRRHRRRERPGLGGRRGVVPRERLRVGAVHRPRLPRRPRGAGQHLADRGPRGRRGVRPQLGLRAGPGEGRAGGLGDAHVVQRVARGQPAGAGLLHAAAAGLRHLRGRLRAHGRGRRDRVPGPDPALGDRVRGGVRPELCAPGPDRTARPGLRCRCANGPGWPPSW